MKQMFLFVFVLFLFQLSTAKITAEFSVTPDDFSLGTQFTAKCTVSGFETSKYFSHAAVFYLNPSDSQIRRNNPKIDFDLATWTVMKSSKFTFC